MPRSKSDKKISLTKTGKKGVALKQKIVEDVRNCVEKYKSVYVFTYKNMRSNTMKEVKAEWHPSRFFFGKNKVIAHGLGRDKTEEVGDDLYKLSAILQGQCALLFTDSAEEDVVQWFKTFSVDEFARSGFKATQTVKLKEGPLKQFAHSIEPYLRQLGMPTKLDKGVVTLIKDFEVCKKGNILKPEQAKILELLDYKLATFKLLLKARWIKGKGYNTLCTESEEQEQSNDEMDTDEEGDD